MTTRRWMGLAGAMLLCAAAMAGCGEAGAPGAASSVKLGQDKVVAHPHAHRNLQVFFIHGPDKLKDRDIVTLEEAMGRNMVAVSETGSVNQIIIENSSNVSVFVHAGDIIKGGKQDRTIRYDMLLPSMSGKRPVDCFCVEHGRWTNRGSESVAAFSGSTDTLVTNSQRLAVQLEGDQSKVWEEVEISQNKLRDSAILAGVGTTGVQSAASPTSLQLTLENKDLQKAVDEYVAALGTLGGQDVVGCVLAINGKVVQADIYPSAWLFGKFWPKLLKSGATQAIAELKPDGTFKPATPPDVANFMAAASEGTQTHRKVSQEASLNVTESRGAAVFSTSDSHYNWSLRESYIAK